MIERPVTRGREAARKESLRLADLLMDEISRTFAAGGDEQGLEVVRNLLLGLDAETLRGLLHRVGIAEEPAMEAKDR
jgi:hypothetical protein